MEIREATIKDQENIIRFIKSYWAEDHIFVKSPELFRYQYQNGEKLNFILGFDNDEIISILGYIPYSNEKGYEDIFLAMWMTSPHVKTGNIGLLLNKYLLDKGYRSVNCCGIAKKVTGLYKFLGYSTGKLEHYYMLNAHKADFKIAEVHKKFQIGDTYNNQAQLIKIDNFNQLMNQFDFEFYKNRFFYKDQNYIKHRYFEHPYYDYYVFGIPNGQSISCILIMRKIEVNGGKVLRIVDFIGDEQNLRVIRYELNEIIRNGDYEYIDFYQYGISEDILKEAGFTKRHKEDPNIIPNYFEPFERKNVDILFATNVENEKFYMFKGDGDQDRPNLLPGELSK